MAPGRKTGQADPKPAKYQPWPLVLSGAGCLFGLAFLAAVPLASDSVGAAIINWPWVVAVPPAAIGLALTLASDQQKHRKLNLILAIGGLASGNLAGILWLV